MLDSITKRRIDDARDILVGKIPDPKSQVEQITIAFIYKFMDDMDTESEELGGEARFFVGDYSKYSWRKIFNNTRGGQEILLDYREALQQMSENKNLPAIFHTIFRQAYLPYNDPETIKAFLKIINQFEYDHSERLGDAFEYLLSVLGSQGDAGQFRTPRHIIDFMVSIVEPKKNETILDPACGTAGFLISSYKYILKNNSSEGKINGDLLTPDERKILSNNINGYDISPDMVRLSLVNMYLHRISEPKIVEYDTLTSDTKWNEYFDVILANPPFMSPKGGIKPHDRFSIESKRSEALFVDYIAEHLTTTGRGAVIVPEGIIFKTDGAFTKLRKMLIEDNYLYGVISLPSGVFNPYSGVKTSILLFDKVLSKLTDKILFAKVENDGFSLGAQRRPIEGSQLDSFVALLKDYRAKLHRGEVFSSDSVNLVEKYRIAESGDYNLSGERYFSKIVQKSLSYPMVNINDVCDLKRGTPLSSKDFDQSENAVIPVIAGGQKPAGYHNVSNRPENCITVSCSGAYAGFLNYFKIPIFATDCFTITSKNEELLNIDYLYSVLKARQAEIYGFQTGMGQPHVSPKDFVDFEIPLPPIEEQRAIVAEIETYEKENAKLAEQIEENKQKITTRISQIWNK
jgi:Type I restriction-modification system methyltransferase subunit